MKKLLILTCLLLCSCSVTYNVTTESDFQKVRQDMLNTVNSYGYILSDSYTYDTTNWEIVNKIYHPSHYSIESYEFVNEDNDSIKIHLQYRHRCITEAATIPYIDSCKTQCYGNNLVCSEIQSIMQNLPESRVTTIAEGSSSCLIIFAALLPFITIISYAAIFNVK